MSGGWWVWVAGPQGTTVLALCALVLGMILGYLTGRPAGRRAAERDRAERREEARALAHFRQVHPAYRNRRPPEVAHEWEPVHVGQALALANSDPITTGEIEAIGPSMDRWLAEHVYGQYGPA